MTLELTKEQALEILDGDTDEYTNVSDRQIDSGRWSATHELIVQRASDMKFFRSRYSVGLTECQDESPWENVDTVTFKEVVPVEKTVIEYELKK